MLYQSCLNNICWGHFTLLLYTSEFQFGCKAKHGCRDAFSVLYKTVEYGSTVNIVCLDLSKAFDKVYLYSLSGVEIVRYDNLC